MITEYRVRLDREACEGIFACLVRDERFVEAADGLAGINGESQSGDAVADGGSAAAQAVATFEDDRLDEARRAASACPVDAIDVTVVGDEEGPQ